MKCPICFLDHNFKKLEKCDMFLSSLLNKYLILNISFEDINSYIKIKKYQCKNCFKILSSCTNYKKHINSNICKKLQGLKCTSCNKNFKCRQNLEYHLSHKVCGFITSPAFLTDSAITTNNPANNQTNQTNPINQNNTTNISNTTNTANTANTTNVAGNLNNIGTLNNNINNNIQINVNSSEDLKKVVELLPFRETGYKVTTEKYLEYASNPDQAIKQFIKEHHFNPEKPERMNILNTNRRDNRVQLFDYDEDFICRWQTKDKSKIIELLYDRGMNHLFFAKMMLDCAGVKLDPKKETKLKEKIKEYEDDKVKKQCLDMISDMTYDYREMIENNKKTIEKQQKTSSYLIK